MIAYWREAVLAILFVAGFLTPGDVIATMIIFGTVMLALYGVSILIVRLVEPPVQ
jgi:Sec-independent protein secretion pathway component TatC